MGAGAGIEELQALEGECVRRFRSKAAELRRIDPTLTPQVAFAKAVELLPRTANKYQQARLQLGMMGVRALPLR